MIKLTWITTPTMLCIDITTTATPQCSVGTLDPYLCVRQC